MLPRCAGLRVGLARAALPRAKGLISTGVLRAVRVQFALLALSRWRVVWMVVVARGRRVTMRCKRRKAIGFGRRPVVRVQVLSFS